MMKLRKITDHEWAFIQKFRRRAKAWKAIIAERKRHEQKRQA